MQTGEETKNFVNRVHNKYRGCITFEPRTELATLGTGNLTARKFQMDNLEPRDNLLEAFIGDGLTPFNRQDQWDIEK